MSKVELDVILGGDEAEILYDQLGDDREDPLPVRLVVGDGRNMTPAQNTTAYIQGFEDGKRAAKAEIKRELAKQWQGEPAVYIPADALRQIMPPLLILHGVSLYGYHGDGLTPLYTTPPHRKPLTGVNAQLLEVLERFSNYVHAEQSSNDGTVTYSTTTINHFAFLARAAIESACGIKGAA